MGTQIFMDSIEFSFKVFPSCNILRYRNRYVWWFIPLHSNNTYYSSDNINFYPRRIEQPIIPYNRFEPKKRLFSKDSVKAYRNGLMGDKAHLTAEGFAEIVRIKKGKGGMIKGRQMSTIATTPTILPRITRFLYVSPISNFSQRPPEYPLIILFILIGAILLMSSSDLISMFLAIELQSYGLYIFATLHRDSEWSTSAGLTYFLLGGPNWHKKSYIFCLQLSNSGDSLKLLVPSHNWKFVGGWINHSWMVTTQKMLERKMGYRGSKSIVLYLIKYTIVKEQRVDGSWHN